MNEQLPDYSFIRRIRAEIIANGFASIKAETAADYTNHLYEAWQVAEQQRQVATRKDIYVALTNYMRNELELSRKDVNAMVRDEIYRQMKNLLDTGNLQGWFETWVRQQVSHSVRESWVKSALDKWASIFLRDKFDITLKEKPGDTDGLQ